MKRFGLFALGVLVGGLAVGLLGRGGGEPRHPAEAVPDRPVASPSSKHLLMVLEGSDGDVCVRQFAILERPAPGQAEPQEVYACPDRFRTRDRLHFLWDAQDRVWVYSGDLGTFFWERQPDGSWRKHPYAGSNVPPPPALRQLVPTLK